MTFVENSFNSMNNTETEFELYLVLTVPFKANPVDGLSIASYLHDKNQTPLH